MSSPLEKVLEDGDVQEEIHTALMQSCHKDPLAFYDKRVAPLTPKLRGTPTALEMTGHMPADADEEAAILDEATCNESKRQAEQELEALTTYDS